MSADENPNDNFVSWLAERPEIEVMHVAVCDLNGIMRGKRIPIEQALRIADGGIRMPLSIVGVDVWGEDIVGNPLVFVGGDSDGICTPTGRGALPINWTSRPSAMIPLWLFQETGEPFYGDPRQSLALIGRRYAELGLTPVVATEPGILSGRSERRFRCTADFSLYWQAA
ncbi:hypothetical protein PSQ19_15540 [Devosia algicola]|uniref:Glutamine synthetase n=1 Tax=Devosia algicola TaxID=3026418 RepID=A0ABY7YLB2_9HYPH|nr:hypothetical protein PSQ19_15540 [Devosia algicola]